MRQWDVLGREVKAGAPRNSSSLESESPHGRRTEAQKNLLHLHEDNQQSVNRQRLDKSQSDDQRGLNPSPS